MSLLSALRSRPRPTLELLVLQPTPLCNLDCTYCYLPNRRSRARMSREVLDAAVRRAVESPFLGEELTIVWHAGEPLVLGTSWYEDAFARIAEVIAGRTRVTHAFQTNGTRLDSRWLPLLLRPDVRIGVSYDGPAFLHDAARKRLDGSGTHAAVRDGMALLRSAGIPFHVIAVVTRAALAHPEALFDDVASTGAYELGLNFEEQEGIHATSSLAGAPAHGAGVGSDVESEVRAFYERLVAHARHSPSAMRIREFDALSALLMRPKRLRALRGGTQENEGFRVVSVGHDGSFGTWSPELLEHTGDSGAGFVLGNVVTDSFEAAAASPRARALQRAIDRGRAACARECVHYEVCGGGSPSNKVSELGRLDATETRHCRVTRKVAAEVVLAALERDVQSAVS